MIKQFNFPYIFLLFLKLQALISQGGLGDLDDSLLSSSADSEGSYDESSDSSESAVKATLSSGNQIHMNTVDNNGENTNQIKVLSPRYDMGKVLGEKEPERVENNNNNNNAQQEQDESLFGNNLDQTAAPIGNHILSNNADNFHM